MRARPWLDRDEEAASTVSRPTDGLGYDSRRLQRCAATPATAGADRPRADGPRGHNGATPRRGLPQHAQLHEYRHRRGVSRRAYDPASGPRRSARTRGIRGGGGAAARGRRDSRSARSNRAAGALLAEGSMLRDDRGVRHGGRVLPLDAAGRRRGRGSRRAPVRAGPAPISTPVAPRRLGARVAGRGGGRAGSPRAIRRPARCGAPPPGPQLRRGVRRDRSRGPYSREGRSPRRRARARARRSGNGTTCATEPPRPVYRDSGLADSRHAAFGGVMCYTVRLLELTQAEFTQNGAGKGTHRASAPGGDRD